MEATSTPSPSCYAIGNGQNNTPKCGPTQLALVDLPSFVRLTGDALCMTRAALLGPELAGAVIAFARLGAMPPGTHV
eukprot:1147211-Pelagomonas_calceolata.AAC.6